MPGLEDNAVEPTDPIVPDEGGTPTQPQPTGEEAPLFSRELEDGTVKQYTSEELTSLIDQGEKYEGLQTKFGHITNEVGDLRKKLRSMPTAVTPTPPVLPNAPALEFTDDDLADPAALQLKINTALGLVTQGVLEQTREQQELRLQNMQYDTEKAMLLNANPTMKLVKPEVRSALYDAAMQTADNMIEAGAVFANRDEALTSVLSAMGVGGRGQSAQTPTQGTQAIVKNLTRIQSAATVAPQGGASNTGDIAREYLDGTPEKRQEMARKANSDPKYNELLMTALDKVNSG